MLKWSSHECFLENSVTNIMRGSIVHQLCEKKKKEKQHHALSQITLYSKLTLKLRGGSPKKINKTTTSQLRPLATFVPSLGRCGQGAWL